MPVRCVVAQDTAADCAPASKLIGSHDRVATCLPGLWRRRHCGADQEPEHDPGYSTEKNFANPQRIPFKPIRRTAGKVRIA